MSELTDLIKERGHWQVVIRPERHVGRRVDEIQVLFPLVESAAVEIRGWDFPHIDRTSQPHIDVDWVGQESAWQHHLEAWRLYMSGQFLDLAGFPSDWRDRSTVWPGGDDWEPGRHLVVGEAVYKLTEIAEFAARLALTEVGDTPMRVSVCPTGLMGRELIILDPLKVPLMHSYTAHIERLPMTRIIDSEELVGHAAEIAISMARELFARFGWNPSEETLLGFMKPI